ncbi:MAG TPA: cupredoxin domain-containing protein [Kofleriaceae bacterium]|nr:cupredoxin domain-containing protein [Kofleriaceae bacterium]
MVRALLVLLVVVAVGCKKDAVKDTATSPPVVNTAAVPVAKDGVRHIAITADINGYTPSRIVAKPGEKLVLVFTRTLDKDCVEKVKIAGQVIELPFQKPVEVPVTAPQSGELGFQCGMDMFFGSVVAEPAT